MKAQEQQEKMIRILSKDIPGNVNIYTGLTRVKGVSWGVSNAICKLLSMDKTKKVGDLSKEEIEKISVFMKNPTLPNHLLNRRSDFEKDEKNHFITVDLELKTEFDIKRLKKIKSYRGIRHLLGLPMRGQRTKGNFRKNKMKGVGIKKKKK